VRFRASHEPYVVRGYGALNYVEFRAAMDPILNCVEFKTNPEPYIVQGVVHKSWRPKPCEV